MCFADIVKKKVNEATGETWETIDCKDLNSQGEEIGLAEKDSFFSRKYKKLEDDFFKCECVKDAYPGKYEVKGKTDMQDGKDMDTMLNIEKDRLELVKKIPSTSEDLAENEWDVQCGIEVHAMKVNSKKNPNGLKFYRNVFGDNQYLIHHEHMHTSLRGIMDKEIFGKTMNVLKI
jgi:hypothetical protein